ncbi:anthocyanidin reductase ((2S)-flavan-3-ol-forming)-like [Miscanthus floridulus]|uniref:anthocyanidin reductase ((2S)-flavan-3-ol-forming)-like n=1 Tax=Miscanthus floridulus TaxID=154761 RepID=UPI003457675B
MVDVDNLCRTEIFVAEKETSTGSYLCCGLNTTVVQLARFLAHKYPQYDVETNLSGKLLEEPRVCLSSGNLVKEGFEFKYKTLDSMYDDVVEYGKALGILPS